MSRKSCSPAFLLVVVAWMVAAALPAKNLCAQVYNAGAALLANELPNGNPNELLNPNGVWSYGMRTTTLGPGLTLLTAHVNEPSLQGFSQFATGNVHPTVFVNTGAPFLNPNGMIGTGELRLHPDSANGNGNAVVRFTAPTSGVYNVQAYWEDIDSCCTNNAGVDVHVVHNNGASSSSLFSGAVSREANPMPTNTAFASTVTLTAGQSLDFVVGTNGFYAGDSTRTNSLVSMVKTDPIVNVDFNGLGGPAFSGNGVLRANGTLDSSIASGTTSGVWNPISIASGFPNTPVPGSGLVDAAGNLTGVTVSLSGFAGSDDCTVCAGGANNNHFLLRDYLVQNDATGAATLTIGGLMPGEEYDLYLYTTNGGGNVGGTFSVNGEHAVVATGSPGVAGLVTDYLAMVNYVPFLGVEANALGQLVVTATGEPGQGVSIINGFQLQIPAAAVPEPSAIACWIVLVFAAVGCVWRRAGDRRVSAK